MKAALLGGRSSRVGLIQPICGPSPRGEGEGEGSLLELERVLDLIGDALEEIVRALLILLTLDLGELFQQLFLARGERSAG